MKFLALLILIPGLALANDNHEQQPVAGPIASSSSSTFSQVNPNIDASSESSSESSSAASASNSLSTVTNVEQKRQAPSGLLSATNTTAGCFKARGVFLSAPGAGLGLNGGKVDRDCTLLLAADEELRRGNLLASIQLRCATKLYRDVFTPQECLALLDTQTKPKPACVTQEQLDRSFKACNSK